MLYIKDVFVILCIVYKRERFIDLWIWIFYIIIFMYIGIVKWYENKK